MPTPSVPAHKEKLTTGELLNPAETNRQCIGGMLYYIQDRADAQCEVSILGSILGKPTQGSMIALKHVTRYLKGTKDFVNKLELDSDVDKHVARLDGFSDSDWGWFDRPEVTIEWRAFLDGAPLYSFSRRQSVIATSSGMAEFYAGCATAEEMLLARHVLMFFGCQVEASLHMESAEARGIYRRECVGKVKAKTLTLKTVKSEDNCADLGTKKLAAGTLSLLRNFNGLVDKNAMDCITCGVRSVTSSSGEPRKLGATALKVLERTLDEIARNDQIMSGGE